ncbi:MAG: neprosin family prolyl endopeptidase, partial [Exilibacterium sp.]
GAGLAGTACNADDDCPSGFCDLGTCREINGPYGAFCSPASNDRYYAVWHRYADNYGSLGRINIWNTAGPVNAETSIAQVAVIRGTPMQAIEAGNIEYSWLASSNRPTFFTYFRTNGSASGDWVAGYNNLVDGWIQVSGSVAPGMSLIPWESTTNGSQYSLDVEVRLWQGNWWVRAAGEWAGYYPYCKGGDAPPCDQGTLFSASGIRDKAYRLDWYGEVYDSSAPAATSTDMGSGAFANQRWGRAAYFRNLLYMWSDRNAWWWNSGSISTTDSACYSADGPYYSSDPNYRNWFYYGGPGKEAAGCN